jgi:type 1 glutamine amidotransferase
LLLLGAAPLPRGEVLIFSHTTGYRHESIPAGVAAIRRIAERQGFSVRASEDPALFTSRGLRGVRAIVFLSSTTDPNAPSSEWLTGNRRAALQVFVRSGGGVMAVHAAADSHYGWPWYGRLIGGRFTPQARPPAPWPWPTAAIR